MRRVQCGAGTAEPSADVLPVLKSIHELADSTLERIPINSPGGSLTCHPDKAVAQSLEGHITTWR